MVIYKIFHLYPIRIRDNWGVKRGVAYWMGKSVSSLAHVLHPDKTKVKGKKIVSEVLSTHQINFSDIKLKISKVKLIKCFNFK